jgi:hypothetical protein
VSELSRHGWAKQANARLVVLALVLGALLVSVQPAESASNCGTSGGYTVCLTIPDGPLSGDIVVTATLSGGTRAVDNVQFDWGPSRVLSDFNPPYTFTWQTGKFLDGSHTLTARVLTDPGNTVGSPVGVTATLSNGNATDVPRNPEDWASLFQPRFTPGVDPLIAAVGDSGDGSAGSDAVAASVQAADPSLLLYLGDIYEYGTWPEWLNHYGISSWDDPAGVGERWGALASITDPTIGNHEAHLPEVWRDYWHGRPLYRAYTAGGVLFLNVSSECAKVGGCGTASPEYAYFRNVLATNTTSCVVAYWHRPVLSAVSDEAVMQPLWKLIAENGGDLVLNGHTHTMQIFRPLNGSLAAGQPDSHMVEVVSGEGGHNETSTTDNDVRSAWQVRKVLGAAYITAVGGGSGAATRLDWEFRDTQGNLIRNAGGQPGSGSVDCTNPPVEPPEAEHVFSGSVSASGTAWKNHTFSVSAGDHLYVQLDWSDPSANLNLSLKNPSGALVASATGTNKPEVVEANAGASGMWKVTVNAKSGGSSYRVLVNPADALPIARFSVNCTDTTCSFDGSTSSDREGPIADYTWDFGDGATGSGQVVSHDYAPGAVYTATLTVKDSADQTDTATASVSTVQGPAEWVFTGSGSASANTVRNHLISVTAPKHIHAVLDWSDPAARLNLFLKNPSGATVASASGAKPEVLDYDAAVSGTWKLTIVYKAGAATYELLVNPSG